MRLYTHAGAFGKSVYTETYVSPRPAFPRNRVLRVCLGACYIKHAPGAPQPRVAETGSQGSAVGKNAGGNGCRGSADRPGNVSASLVPQPGEGTPRQGPGRAAALWGAGHPASQPVLVRSRFVLCVLPPGFRIRLGRSRVRAQSFPLSVQVGGCCAGGPLCPCDLAGGAVLAPDPWGALMVLMRGTDRMKPAATALCEIPCHLTPQAWGHLLCRAAANGALRSPHLK